MRLRAQGPGVSAEARGIALLRLALVPIALVAAASRRPAPVEDVFPWAVGALAVYAIAALVLAFTGARDRRLTVAQAVADLLLVALLVYATGGARSPLKFTFYVLPVGAALRLSPRLTATWLGLSIVAYLAVAVPHPDTSISDDVDLLAADSLALLWVGAAAVMLSTLVGRRQRALAEFAATRRALVQQALDAEARERRRLAEVLHDHAIQDVLVARQEIADIARGVEGADQRAREALDDADQQLRREVFRMHPLGLERAGLSAVLRGLAQDAARRGGFSAQVTVDPAAEHGDPQHLLVSSARELLVNVAKHARATRVDVHLAAAPDRLTLTVTDDGSGIDASRLQDAVSLGHIGVASMVERVRAIDGSVTLDSAPGGGTIATVIVPVPPRTPLDADRMTPNVAHGPAAPQPGPGRPGNV